MGTRLPFSAVVGFAIVIIRSPVFGDCDSGTEISENTLVLFCVPSHTVSRS